MSAIESFKKQTGFDIQQFFEGFEQFLNNSYSDIVSYYKGGDLNSTAFEEFSYFKTQCSVIEPLFDFISSNDATLDMWQLLDVFEDVQTKIQDIDNLSKWTQSTFHSGMVTDVLSKRILKTNESLESVMYGEGSKSPQDDWMKLAVDNNLVEEDYSISGIVNGSATSYLIRLENNDQSLKPTVVIDSLNENLAKGKDISLQFIFQDNDLLTIESNNVLSQSAYIILNTIQGDIPESPTLGIPDILVGSNVSSIQYPLLLRGLSELFATDDRWKIFELTNMERKDDFIKFNFQFSSIFEDYKIEIQKNL